MDKFDMTNGGFMHDVGGGTMMDMQGNLFQDVGGGMAMDLQNGEMHLTSGGSNTTPNDGNDWQK